MSQSDDAFARNPHDALFRHTFGKPEHAASELRSVLPASLSAAIDFSSLTLEPGSYVSKALRSRYSDLLFSARMNERRTLLYVLFEHQSTEDRWMPLRLLEYMVAIWQRFRREHDASEPLPLIVPVVLSHATNARFSTLLDLTELDPDLREVVSPFVPSFRYLVDDLARQSVDSLRTRSELTLVARQALLALRLARTSSALFAHLETWLAGLKAIREAGGNDDDFEAIVRYTVWVSEIPPDRWHELTAGLDGDTKEAFVKTAQMFIEQGKAEGREQGKAEGREQGKAEGRADALIKLATLRFGVVGPDTVERIRGAGLDDLDRWTERVLTASTLEDTLK